MSRYDPKLMKKNDILIYSLYLIKTVSKAIVGLMVGSGALLSDAVHGLADLIQYFFISKSTKLSQQQRDELYPRGRKALQNVVAVMVATMLFISAIGFFLQGLLRGLNAFGAVHALENASGIQLNFLHAEAGMHSGSGVVVGITLLIMAILSFVVFRIEIKYAEKLGPAIRGDALELRSDGIVELVVSIAFFGAGGIGILAGSDHWLTQVFGSNVDWVAQIAISYFVFKSGIEVWQENGPILQGMAIPKEEQDQLVEHLSEIDGVVGDHANRNIEVTAYYLGGNRVRVECKLPVYTTMGLGIQLAIQMAEARVTRMLGKRYDGGVDVSISVMPIQLKGDETRFLDQAIAHYLRDVWKIPVSGNSRVEEMMHQFATSQFDEALNTASAIESAQQQSVVDHSTAVVLSKYVRLYCNFWKHRFTKGYTDNAAADLHDLLQKYEGSLDQSAASATKNALTFIEIEKISVPGITRSIGLEQMRTQLKERYEDERIERSVRGEAAHLLARSYYKVPDYDLELARNWFSKARDVAIAGSGGVNLLFSDRLWTDWGNFEALFHHLDDAERYLQMAVDLKRLHNDMHGLAIAYGCLAKVAARQGNLDLAIGRYQQDLELATEADVKSDIDHVKCYLAETLIKRALLSNDVEDVNWARELVRDVIKNASTNPFAYKAMSKVAFAQWYIDEDNDASLKEIKSSVDNFSRLLSSTESHYLLGLRDRARGRLEMLTGTLQRARESFVQARDQFAGVHGNPDLPLQVILTELDALTCAIFDLKTQDWTEKVSVALEKVSRIVADNGHDWPSILRFPERRELVVLHKQIVVGRKSAEVSGAEIRLLIKRALPVQRIIWLFEV